MGRGRSMMGQDGSRSRQKAPSWIKISPKRANMSQRKTEMGQDRVKMGPRWGQDGANMGQAGAKMGQDGAKIGPTWANIGPRWAKMRHRGYPPVSPRSHCKKQQKPTCFRGRRLGGRNPFLHRRSLRSRSGSHVEWIPRPVGLIAPGRI